MSAAHPKALIIDAFIPAPLVALLLDLTLASKLDFKASTIDGDTLDSQVRSSLRHDGDLSLLKREFQDIVRERQNEIIETFGVPSFNLDKMEIELVAHGNGGFYQSHIDTYTRESRRKMNSDRIISAVFYFHRKPKAFSGGELAIYPFGSSEPSHLIEPINNRLVAFPSFLLHEVRPVRSSSDDFADSRFSINCWLRRARKSSADT